MDFKRTTQIQLQHWQTKPQRKPLLLMGARQIGKTTLLKSFGSTHYDSALYINLEKEVEAHKLFEGNKDPRAILESLALIHGQEIQPHKTLIILDEIQECRDALIALKYFAEEAPDIHLICAGSLLGLSIGNNRSFPVGKVEFLDMYPLAFSEYLERADPKLYKSYLYFLDKEPQPLPDIFHKPLSKLFKEYILFGGMPEVASNYITHRDVNQAILIQENILRAYGLDFVKHAEKTTSTRIQHIWEALPSQLAKENKKFLYKAIRSGARAREYEEAIQWLVQSGLVYKTPKVETAKIPLKAYEDTTAFKLYTFETGLLIRHGGLDPSSFINESQLFTEFKGALAENYVATALKKTNGTPPYYWTSRGKAEIDFVIEKGNDILPIEVKSGNSTKAKSLAVFAEKYNPQLKIRISNRNLQLKDGLLNIPLYYAEYVEGIMGKLD